MTTGKTWCGCASWGCTVTRDPALFIETPEGIMRADEGDYIVRGIAGEFYPVKKEIFERTYEAATD